MDREQEVLYASETLPVSLLDGWYMSLFIFQNS